MKVESRDITGEELTSIPDFSKLLANATLGDFEQVFFESLTRFGKTRLSINFLEIATTLIEEGLALPFDTVYPALIPANSAVTINFVVDTGYVFLKAEDRIVIGTDHALSLNSVFDTNRLIYNDPDMVQARYSNARNYFAIGSIFPVRHGIVTTVTNSTNNAVYFSIEVIGAKVREGIWNSIIADYFKTLLSEIKK